MEENLVIIEEQFEFISVKFPCTLTKPSLSPRTRHWSLSLSPFIPSTIVLFLLLLIVQNYQNVVGCLEIFRRIICTQKWSGNELARWNFHEICKVLFYCGYIKLMLSPNKKQVCVEVQAKLGIYSISSDVIFKHVV